MKNRRSPLSPWAEPLSSERISPNAIGANQWKKMKKIIATGEPNVYTISKNGMKKIIWQGTWEKDGQVAGLVEISIPLPESMPHYDRG